MIIYEPKKRESNTVFHCDREKVTEFYTKYNLEQVGRNGSIRVHNAKDSKTPSCK